MPTMPPRPAGIDPRTLLPAALTAAARGWRVFPLRPGEKRPAIRNWQTRATRDPDRITRCWASGPYNIGIATGPSGLLVVDLDMPKPDEEPPERWQQPGVHCGEDVLAALAEQAGEPVPYDTHAVWTGRGGLHLYFTAPAGVELRNTAGRLGWLVDTRAAGGYVVADGSVVDGHAYTTANEAPTAPLPFWLRDLLTTTPPPAAPDDPVDLPPGRASAYLAAALRAEADRVRNAPVHQRNNSLYVAAVALGQLVAGGALTDTQVRNVLRHASDHHVAAGAYSERQRDTTIASGLKAGAKRPRPVAA